MLAEHQSGHSRTREMHAEHEKLTSLSAARCSGEPDVAHPNEVAVEEGDKGFGLGSLDEGHVVAQASRERGGLRDGLQPRRMVPLNHREGDLYEQRSASDGVVASATVKQGIDPVGALTHSSVSPVLPE